MPSWPQARAAYARAAEALSARAACGGGDARRGGRGRACAAQARFGALPDRDRAGRAGPSGTDRVEFEVSTNPGAPFGPLTRIAQRRRAVALHPRAEGRAGRGRHGATMIFDEIDRGVGGAVASAIGERLARLAQKSQLLVVTHSPQVAARATHHYRIEKSHGAGRHPHLGAQLDAEPSGARKSRGCCRARRSPTKPAPRRRKLLEAA